MAAGQRDEGKGKGKGRRKGRREEEGRGHRSEGEGKESGCAHALCVRRLVAGLPMGRRMA
jgi:hypothetical protein